MDVPHDLEAVKGTHLRSLAVVPIVRKLLNEVLIDHIVRSGEEDHKVMLVAQAIG